MMEVTRKAIEEIEALKKQKQNLLALLRGGHVQPKEMTVEEAIKRVLADIAQCDEAKIEITQIDAQADVEIRSRFFHLGQNAAPGSTPGMTG